MDEKRLRHLMLRMKNELRECVENLEDNKPVLAFVKTDKIAGTMLEMFDIVDAK